MSITAISQPVPAESTYGSKVFAVLAGWHLLSLDAPSVAVVWMLLFNRAAPVRDRSVEACALGLAVWCIYAADRLMDARYGSGALYSRHYFHLKNQRLFGFALIASMPVMAALLWLLPEQPRLGWLSLGLPLGLYAAAVHGAGARRLPKEIFVSVFFALAVLLPAMRGTAGNGHLIVEAGVFGALCWLNCVAIARWEKDFTRRSAPSTRFGARNLAGLLAIFAIASLLLAALHQYEPVALACAGSAALLLLLHTHRHEASGLELRTLADLSLMTPLLVLPFLR